jgi:hypothetical protein
MRRTQTSLESLVADRIWVSERPVKFSGAWLRARSLVIRLEDGGLWIHSPPEPTEELRAAIDQLGVVRWLVVPNRFHHLGTPAFAAAYPDATVVGPASVLDKNPALRLDGDVTDRAFAKRTRELLALPLAGVPFLDETIFFHSPTRTLIGADLMLCACRKDHWSWRWPARVFGAYDKLKVPPDVRFKTKASAETAAALGRILALPIERISVAHADLITEDPKGTLARAWKVVLRRVPEAMPEAAGYPKT